MASKLKKFRVHFEISGSSYRDIEAFDEEDATEQCQNDWVNSEDCERANFSQVDIDHVEELKPKKKKRV